MLHRRATFVVAAALSAVLIVASAASAHVSVQPGSAAKGSFSIFSFSVPNEKDDANTVKLEVTFPTKTPIASVSVKPMPGWTITTEKTKLAKPVKTDDGDVTEAVSKVTWTATAGGLQPGRVRPLHGVRGPAPDERQAARVPDPADLQRRRDRAVDPDDGEGRAGAGLPGADAHAHQGEQRAPLTRRGVRCRSWTS